MMTNPKSKPKAAERLQLHQACSWLCVASSLCTFLGANIAFSHRIYSSLSAEQLFVWLEKTLKDTDEEPLWPTKLNRVRIPHLKSGETFQADYRLPFASATRNYELRDVQAGRGFVYVPAADHPFSGSVRIEVEPAEDGSVLVWEGAYEAAFWRPERAVFKYYFEPRFFGELRRSLIRLSPPD